MDSQKNTSTLRSWAELVRIPAVFTVIADVTAGFLLAAKAVQPEPRYLAVVFGAICLYWAGMILNDVFDLDKDREERPHRPLPSDRVPLSTARTVGWSLLGVGVVAAGLSGWLPADEIGGTPFPLVIAVVLAGLIVAYDGPLKRTPIGPLVMGSCRFLSLLLGASPVLMTAGFDFGEINQQILCAAAGMGIYIAGITHLGRDEATSEDAGPIFVALGVSVAGMALIAYSPRVFPQGDYFLNPDTGFPILVALIGLTVINRIVAAGRDPGPAKVQAAVRHGVLTIIPLSAALAFLGAGPIYGLLVFLLVFPALTLAAVMRVT